MVSVEIQNSADGYKSQVMQPHQLVLLYISRYCSELLLYPLTPNDIYIYIYMCVCVSYRTANLKTLHFIYLVNKYTY
jgi:hypothetical protein